MRKMLRKIMMWIWVCALLWVIGLCWFLTNIPKPHDDMAEIQTDVIVVLTGGGGRLEYGMELLADNKGKKLFVSGVSKSVTVDELIRRQPSPKRAKIVPYAGDIVLGYEAENTIGNAQETAQWIRDNNVESIRLVTADFHMPRSLLEFSQALPGVSLVADPVFTDEFSGNRWWRDREARKLLLSEYHKFLAAKLRHVILSHLIEK